MVKWIRRINWKKACASATIYTAVSMAIRQLEAFFTSGFYTDPAYAGGIWNRALYPREGYPSPEFYIALVILTFVAGLGLTFAYYYIHEGLPKAFWKRVFFFADLTVAMSFIFFTLPAFLMFNVPVHLLVSWFVSGFVILTMESYVLAKIVE